MIKKIAVVLLLPLVVLSLSGCMSDLTGETYSRQEARHTQIVKFGTVAEVRLVKLEGTQSGVGTIAGGAVGGIAAGSNIGSGSGSTVAAIAGAVAGGVLGSMAEEKLTTKQGVELTIKLENGSYISVVQQVDPNAPLTQGDRVKVLSQGDASRVVKVQ
ncbi:glycine zipper 2TM domain-containing protein [Endozoicomonas sp.]|nr:glycine zipper 2TM domain-containing protein [Endozoicomonas sp.]